MTQADGKIVIGRAYFSIQGFIRDRISRLNTDGTLDTGFDPNVNDSIYPPASSVTMQADGKIVIAGDFTGVAGVSRNHLGRLNSDGTLDATFNPNANGSVYGTAIQPDGKIIIGGSFTTVGGVARNRIARLNADGTLEAGFDPNVGGNYPTVSSVTVQSDGKIILGGGFTNMGGITRNRIARLNADGTLEAGFDPNVGGDYYSTVSSVAVQPDGKIIIAGGFTSVGGVTRNGIARLNADGTLDSGFNPNPNNGVYGLAAQADGKIIIGGDFTSVDGITRNHIARLNRDGTLDTSFNPNADSAVLGLAAQADGKLLLGGFFTAIGGVARPYCARLENDTSIQSLAVPSTNRVRWLRGGAAPEAQSVTFELSADGAINWTPLGNGTRISGGWELTGLSLPASGHIRARARIAAGDSSGLVETVAVFPVPEIAVEQPDGTLIAPGGIKNYGAVVVVTASNLTFTVRNLGSLDLTGLGITLDGADAAAFSVTAGLPSPVVGPDGSTTFTVQFAPTSIGQKTATLHIASNDPDGDPFDILLAGTGGIPEIVVEQPAGTDILDGGVRDFGQVTTGFTSNRTFIIKNTGDMQLAGLGVTIDGPDASQFTVTTNPAASVSGSGGSTTFTVRFAPDSPGPKTAALHIANNDPDENPFDITLTGTGIPPAPEITVEQPLLNDIPDGGTSDFGVLLINAQVSRSFTIRNTGTADLAGLGVTLDGSDTDQFSVTASPVAPVSHPAGTTTFTLRFKPTSVGPKTAVLRIANNDPDENPFDITLTGTGRNPVPGDVDTGFHSDADNAVYSVAVQPDGKIVLGGSFVALNGTTRSHVARLHSDGTLDDSFDPNANGAVSSLALQPDGKIIMGGAFTSVGGVTRNRIVRMHPDGSLDTGFDPDANSTVLCLAVQPDGKILLGGWFTKVGGVTRNHVARLNADGELDTSFDPNADWDVYSMVVQPDGNILLGGVFSSIGGVARNWVARLHADGTLDSSFNPDASTATGILALQPDGKIFLGGDLPAVGGPPSNYLKRLNADGTLAPNFNPDVDSIVSCFALQTDGKIVIGGRFSGVGGVTRNYVARLNTDGRLDSGFNPDVNGLVYCMALQANGKIIIGGTFTAANGVSSARIARLENEAASTSLTTPNSGEIRWLRGGTSPEAQDVTFDLSTDSGDSWTPLGWGTRIPGGWELTGLSLPASGIVRASARVMGGYRNGSSGLVETVATIPDSPLLVSPFFASNQFRFRLPTLAGRIYQVQFTPTLAESPSWETVRTVTGDGTVVDVSFATSTPAGFYRVVLQP